MNKRLLTYFYIVLAKWYRLTAAQGDADDQFSLGFMYQNGQGVPQDYQEAAKWYRLAAEQGNAAGQVGLASLYIKGQGVPQDYVLAHMWINLATSQGTEVTVKTRDIIATKMNSAQLAEAQQLAREWKPKGK